MQQLESKEGDLRIWWMRNLPSSPEFHYVSSLDEAKSVYERLVREDLADAGVEDNVGGLEVFEGGEWGEWYDEQGEGFSELMEPVIRG